MSRSTRSSFGRYWAPVERENLLELLPSHEVLLREHRRRVHALFLIAVDSGALPPELSFIIADLAGEFGRTCLQQGAGEEFVVGSLAATPGAIVIPLDVAGLVTIMNAVVPEGASLVTTRPAGTSPILVVDAGDEPRVTLLQIPLVEPCC